MRGVSSHLSLARRRDDASNAAANLNTRPVWGGPLRLEAVMGASISFWLADLFTVEVGGVVLMIGVAIGCIVTACVLWRKAS